jgi:hypothetical protein
MSYFLLLCVIGLAGLLWRSHRKHEDALELLRGDIAILRAKYHDLKRAIADKP